MTIRGIYRIEKALKCELRSCDVDAMDEIAKDLECAAKQYNIEILHSQVKTLRGSNQYRLAPFKEKKQDSIRDKESIKERRGKHLRMF